MVKNEANIDELTEPLRMISKTDCLYAAIKGDCKSCTADLTPETCEEAYEEWVLEQVVSLESSNRRTFRH